MAGALMKYETIDAEQINDIMSGKEPREPKGWSNGGDGGSGGTQAKTPSSDKASPETSDQEKLDSGKESGDSSLV